MVVLGLSCSMWTLSCGTWDLVPWPGIEPMCAALRAWSLSHWTIREVPRHDSFEGCLSVGQMFWNFSKPKNHLESLWKCRFSALICRAFDSTGRIGALEFELLWRTQVILIHTLHWSGGSSSYVSVQRIVVNSRDTEPNGSIGNGEMTCVWWNLGKSAKRSLVWAEQWRQDGYRWVQQGGVEWGGDGESKRQEEAFQVEG